VGVSRPAAPARALGAALSGWRPLPADVAVGSVRALEGGDTAVARVAGGWFAFEDRCPHAGCLLSSDGELDGEVLICNCHGSEFDLATGAVLRGPAVEGLRMHPTRVAAGRPEVLIPPG
jgi:nitrite reductase/ring-hydroxylating ferredoxin subunit